MKSTIRYIPRVLMAFILVQSLFFKFGIGGNEALSESQALFSALTTALFGNNEWEAVFRIGTGILELIASILVLISPYALYGAILGLGLMLGAILSHLFFIGVSIQGDGGLLMIMAIVVFICCIKILYDEKEKLNQLIGKFTSR